ncbi:Uncharacterised protein [uncultured archaeon]|nr:Uncharacterised protein [uncultured archaeon]
MNLDELIKYIIWIAFFIMASAGLYFLLKQIGVV